LAALAEPIHKADADIYHWSVQERAEQEEPTGRVMSALTQSGQLIFVLPVVGLSVGGGDVRHASSEALRAELVTTAFVETLKKLTRRPRPEGGEGSFPSGHAAAAFAEATTIASYYPNLRVPLYTWAAGVAASRVYLGRHYLTDVLVGSALGIWVAKSVHKNKSWPLGIRW
jgi:undecaprenyl-diphosphatase